MDHTESKFCNKLNSFRIVNINKKKKKKKKKIGEGHMKVSIFSLKTQILLAFLRLGSKLFYSIIADRKK